MFPPYCAGLCTLLPISYVKSAFSVAKNTNPGDFHNEDVLFTGIIRVKSGAPEPTKVNGICTHYNDVDKVEKIRRGCKKLTKKTLIQFYRRPTVNGPKNFQVSVPSSQKRQVVFTYCYNNNIPNEKCLMPTV